MVLNKLFHVSLITTVNGEERIGTSPWQGDLLTLVYLAVLIGASYITFHTIEEPCRKWFKSVVRSQRRRTARFQRQLAVD
jgi:peptidoglycan/LPS O-acetylase OafA/YrhL